MAPNLLTPDQSNEAAKTACLLSGYPIGLVKCGQSVMMVTWVLHRSSLAWCVVIITTPSFTVYTGWIKLQKRLPYMGYFLHFYLTVRCQNSSRILRGGLMSFITTFVSYFQAKNFKGTLLIYQGAFHQGRNRGRGQLEYPPSKHIICCFRNTCQTAFQMKARSPLTASKALLRVSVTNVGFLSTSKWRQTQQKKHLPLPTHVLGPNPGSPNKTISSAERQCHSMHRHVRFQVSSVSTRELRQEKSSGNLQN